MPRERNPNCDRAHEIYRQHDGKITNREIARQLGEDEKVIAVWKSRYKWNVVQQTPERCTTRRKGGQPGNKNAVGHGAPKGSRNAEKFGFFSKHLPEETMSIIQDMPTDPLDILWDQVQIAYAAIIRAQSIMYVRDKDDVTTTQIQEKIGDSVTEERWEVQQAWDKQANFLQAQARAQKSLEGLIRQYNELLHKNWDLATEEQKARIMHIQAQTEKMYQSQVDGNEDGVNIINDAPERS